MDFRNKAVLVTGGASGIGLARCRESAQPHADVAIVDLDEKAAPRAAKELRGTGGRVESLVSTSASVGSLICMYALPQIIKRGVGALVITRSAQSAAAVSNSVHDRVSKHCARWLTRSRVLDYARRNIRASCVLPGGAVSQQGSLPERKL